MQQSSHIKIISLALAFSVVTAAWLFFEYSNQPSVKAKPSSNQKAQVSAQPPFPEQITTSPVPHTNNLTVTYKCENRGHISFSDQPCLVNHKTLSVTATAKEAPATQSNFQQLKKQLSVMEANRLERERQYAASVTSPKSSNLANQREGKEFRCKYIDEQISIIDSQLRQPHNAQRGDYLTSERKKLTDERYFLRC